MAERGAAVSLAHRLQAALAGAVFAVVRLLPVRMASALGGFIGRTIGPISGKNRIARRNIERAMPELSPAEVDAVLRGMWVNLGRTLFEFPHLLSLRFEGPDAEIEVVGADRIAMLRDDGEAGIFFSAHMANWETAALSVVNGGLPIHLIYRPPNNPAMEPLFGKRHPGAGELLPKGSRGAKRALQLLKAGEHLGILVDQKMNDGIPVPFFGRDAMTAPALAQFALRFDCPVVPVRVERLDGCRFRITHHAPLEIEKTGDAKIDVRNLMAEINAMLEGWIRERPEQWFWVHRRWPD